ncbi:MAG TPA: monovalent cation/H+ antiporter complex subunit F [Glaciihabitans sp.]|nr:monovalent cation/H+ antiporter complex subunit F [Glaciihabitans sp.]
MSFLYLAIGVLFSAGAMLALYRVVAGPSILDRMIASDVLLTTLMLIVGAEMVINSHTRTIPVMLVLASTAMFATVAVARYVSKQDRTAPEERLNESDEQPMGESPVETRDSSPVRSEPAPGGTQ